MKEDSDVKGEKDIKVKQFAIAAKKSTLKRGINLKTEIEKVREQIQNIE